MELLYYICLFIFIAVIGIIFLLSTVLSFFWFVYLVNRIVYRRKLLRSNLQRNKIEIPKAHDFSFYNNKTFLVRDAFLLAMLVTEWLAGFFGVILISFDYLQTGRNCVNTNNNRSISWSDHHNISFFSCFLATDDIFSIKPGFISSLFLLAYSCLMLCTVLIISLCKYLAARYARLSWIKSNTIPYFIFISVLIIVIINVLKFVNLLLFPSECILWVFEVVLLGLMFREFRKLLIVMNWSCIDLSIAQNQPILLRTAKLTIKRFKKLIIILWIGIFLFVFYHFLHISISSIEIFLNFVYNDPEKLNFYKLNPQYIPLPVIIVISQLSWISISVAFLAVSLPLYINTFYIVYVIIWRCVKGKSGFKTHFSYQDLKTPLFK